MNKYRPSTSSWSKTKLTSYFLWYSRSKPMPDHFQPVKTELILLAEFAGNSLGNDAWLLLTQ